MATSIAYLGPAGTYTETVTLAYAHWRETQAPEPGKSELHPYPNIAQTVRAVAEHQAELAVVPVENSIQGSVAITLDTLWELDRLHIQKALVLPINHTLLSFAPSLAAVGRVYSHPQALAQCQKWLEKHLPQVDLIPTNSTTEALVFLKDDPEAATISSPRASELYQVPTLAKQIQDYPDNCTRFWVLGRSPKTEGTQISLAFTTHANVPGALVTVLEIFARRQINLSRIESRPTKRYLGEYLFFLDLEGDCQDPKVKSALEEIKAATTMVKILGGYRILRF